MAPEHLIQSRDIAQLKGTVCLLHNYALLCFLGENNVIVYTDHKPSSSSLELGVHYGLTWFNSRQAGDFFLI